MVGMGSRVSLLDEVAACDVLIPLESLVDDLHRPSYASLCAPQQARIGLVTQAAVDPRSQLETYMVQRRLRQDCGATHWRAGRSSACSQAAARRGRVGTCDGIVMGSRGRAAGRTCWASHGYGDEQQNGEDEGSRGEARQWKDPEADAEIHAARGYARRRAAMASIRQDTQLAGSLQDEHRPLLGSVSKDEVGVELNLSRDGARRDGSSGRWTQA